MADTVRGADMADGKRCCICGQDRPLALFYKRARSKDGLQAFCIDCGRIEARESYRRRHPDRRTSWTPEKDRAFRQRYRDRNRERIRERDRRFKREEAARDPERVRLRRAAWEEANPERVRANWVRNGPVKRARKAAATISPISPNALAQKMAYWGNRCWLCGGPHEATDHVKPLAKGGLHCLANLRPICGPCNSRKRDRWPFPTHRR